MKAFNDVIAQLSASLKSSPQDQLAAVVDISRRGFLKQVLNVTLYGTLFASCSHRVFAEGIDGLPDLGDSDRNNLSTTQADLLGKQVVLNLYAQGIMLNDYDSLDYLNNLGNDLVSYSPLASSQFNFYLIKDKEINAFALPGGYICAYNGLIYTTLSEAELSSVIAHEIGHVVQHHIFRNLTIRNRAQWLSLAGLLAGALLAPLNPGMAIIAAQSGQGLGVQNMLSFSRDYEREADRVGQQLMYRAGFDAHAMPEFFERMQDTYKFNTNDALAFLQTHPVTVERIGEAENRANQLAVKMRPDSIDFLLVREKCRVRQLGGVAAQKFYQQAILTKRYVSLDAQLYGLAVCYFMNKDLAQSIISLNKITNAHYLSHPIVLGLKARQLIARQDLTLADKLYDQALSSYPNHKGLWMGQLEFLIASKKFSKAATRLEILAQNFPNDADVWDQYAILYSDANYNNALRYRYALGNEYLVLGNYKAALDQYQSALKIKPSQVGDNNIQDLISAKIPDTMRQL